MIEVAFHLLGGIGLFLVGMMLLSDGLTTFAGDSVRRALVRFTGTPVKAFASGTLTTLVVQSSAATTVTLIGFVSAGLIAFPQAIGVVFGASLGTTATGWVVAGLGLKVSLGLYVLPLIGIGAFLKLLGRGRTRALGVAMAGFGLIFVGLDFLQGGMQGLAGRFDFAALPVGGLGSHLVIMLIGALMTALMQSSTAAVATTLTALHTGTVNMEQAAALVVGAAIGTTITGALAAIGGSVAAKRTALAHVVFNSATGLIAIVLLPAYLAAIQGLQQYLGVSGSAISLAAFHTSFIAVGVLIFLPQADRFARLIERLLPERQPSMIRYLDSTVLTLPSVALEVTHRALIDLADNLLRVYEAQVRNRRQPAHDEKLRATAHALEKVQEFIARIPVPSDGEPLLPQRVALVHAIDHLLRFQDRLEEPRIVVSVLTDQEGTKALNYAWRLARGARHYFEFLAGEPREREQAFEDTVEDLTPASVEPPLDGLPTVSGAYPGRESRAGATLARMAHIAQSLTDLMEEARRNAFEEMATGVRTTEEALQITDGLRWLERTGHHIWRFSHYLTEGSLPGVATPASMSEDLNSDTALDTDPREAGLLAEKSTGAGREIDRVMDEPGENAAPTAGGLGVV